jgi:hypothetical protein
VNTLLKDILHAIVALSIDSTLLKGNNALAVVVMAVKEPAVLAETVPVLQKDLVEKEVLAPVKKKKKKRRRRKKDPQKAISI